MQKDLGTLLLRLAFGGLMALAHGWPKLINYYDKVNTFADPLGIGSALSLIATIFTEFFLGVAIAVGIYTRLSALPLAFTMFIATFVVHGSDPFKKMELALIYLIGYLAIFCLGPGKISLDYLIRKKN